MPRKATKAQEGEPQPADAAQEEPAPAPAAPAAALTEAEVDELPKAIVRRLVKDKLSHVAGGEGAEVIVNKGAMAAFAESARIFIHYLSAAPAGATAGRAYGSLEWPLERQNPAEYQESANTLSLTAHSCHVETFTSSSRQEPPKVKVDMEAKLRAWLESKGKTKSIQRMDGLLSSVASKKNCTLICTTQGYGWSLHSGTF